MSKGWTKEVVYGTKGCPRKVTGCTMNHFFLAGPAEQAWNAFVTTLGNHPNAQYEARNGMQALIERKNKEVSDPFMARELAAEEMMQEMRTHPSPHIRLCLVGL